MASLPLPSSADGEIATYLQELRVRLSRLEQESAKLLTDEQRSFADVERLHHELKVRSADFEADLRKLDAELGVIVRRVQSLVAAFKSSARAREYERLSRRVDAWKGERFITRDEYKRLLEKELS